MKSHVRVLIIGGGAVGCSALYHLTRLGWRDVALVERDELTSGSTWHAAGNCPTFSTSWNILKLQRYGNALYQKLAAEVDYPINYHVTGSIRLAHSDARMEEYAHVVEMARAQGIDFELIGPNEIKSRYPLIELDDIKGGLWDPYDGDIDPSQLTQAFAKGARDQGAEIYRFNPVTAIAARPDGVLECHHQERRHHCRDRRQCRGLSRRRGGADDGAGSADRRHAAPVHGDGAGSRACIAQPAPAAAARSRYQLLPAPGARRADPRPL